MAKFMITSIDWETDGEEVSLPTEEIVDGADDADAAVDALSDNRNDSDDSRDSTLGPVDTRCVLGRALLLAVPGPTADTEQRDWSRVGILN